MKTFKSINEFKQDLITILYCGGFKPLSGAHINMIDKYLENPNVKKVVLFISPGKREDINADDAYYIAKKVLKDRNIEIVLDKKSYSPILSAYRWIQNPKREPGKYAMISSSKGDDYKRVKEFLNNYTVKKYKDNLPKGVEVVEYSLDINPLTYDSGDDKGKPISSSRIRQDIKDNNYEKFKENYPALNNKIVKFIWDALHIEKPTKNIEEAGNDENTQQSGGSNYERVYPSQKYKSIKNIYDN